MMSLHYGKYQWKPLGSHFTLQMDIGRISELSSIQPASICCDLPEQESMFLWKVSICLGKGNSNVVSVLN
jgi:hypothetical protein